MIHPLTNSFNSHSFNTPELTKGGGGGSDLESLPKVMIDSNGDDNFSISVVDLLVKAEMASSKGEAKRLIKGEDARVNDA